MGTRRVDRGGHDTGPGGSPAGLLIGLAVGGVLLLAALGGGGYLAYRALSGGPGPGQPGPPPAAGRGEVTVYPELLRLDEPSDRFVALLVPSAAGPVVVARRTDGPTLRADRLDWAQRRKAGSFALPLHNLDNPRDVRPDGGLVAFGRQGDEFMELAALSDAGADVVAKGTAPARGRDLLFVDRSRWVVARGDDALELWEGLDEKKRHTLRPPAPGAAPGASAGRDAAVSPDGKALAVWKGDFFELLDLGTRKPRGRTAALALQGGEWGVKVRRAAFSPDGRCILALLEPLAQGASEPELACWDVQGGAAPRRFAAGSDEGLWWGSGHVVAVPHDGSARGRVYDAATGYLVCALEHPPARRASVSGDGALWFLAPNGPEATFVARVPYPARAIGLLAPAPGATGVVRVPFQYPPD